MLQQMLQMLLDKQMLQMLLDKVSYISTKRLVNLLIQVGMLVSSRGLSRG